MKKLKSIVDSHSGRYFDSVGRMFSSYGESSRLSGWSSDFIDTTICRLKFKDIFLKLTENRELNAKVNGNRSIIIA